MSQRKRNFYPLGLFGYTLSYQAFSNRVQFYYIDVLGLGAATVSTIWFLFGFWNAINDPLMGQLSDRTRSRWAAGCLTCALGQFPWASHSSSCGLRSRPRQGAHHIAGAPMIACLISAACLYFMRVPGA